MRIAATGMALLLLAACGSEKSGTIEAEGGDVDYAASQSGSDTSVSVEGPDGQEVRMTSGADAEVSLMPGFTIYPGAKVLSNTTITQEDGQGILVSLASTASVDAMISHYRKEAEAAGVKIAMETKSGEGKMIGGESEKGLAFSFVASPVKGGSTGQLMLGMDIVQ